MTFKKDNVIRNGKISTFENLLFSKSNESIDKILRIIFFKTLEIKQMAEIISWAFTEEKWLNIDKSSKHFGVLTWCILSFFLQLTQLALNTNNISSEWKSVVWQPLEVD